MMSEEQLLYYLALGLVSNIGDVHISILLEYFKDPKLIFSAKCKELESINGIGTIRANAIKTFKDYKRVETELNFIRKNAIKILVKGDVAYPKKMEHLQDAPHVMFYKGSVDINEYKIVSVIGTRLPTNYGKERVIELIKTLSHADVLVVSGLAYGIDTIAHKQSIKMGLPTIGVLGHGLDQIYPNANRSLAIEMLKKGGLLTEFMSQTKPDKQNFPLRNRIVSGIADAIIVIESGDKGGSLITANMANAYNKDVFAFPGRSIDAQSIGCNELIKTQRALLINNGEDFLTFMNWKSEAEAKMPKQSALFLDLSNEEKQIIQLMSKQEMIAIDHLAVLAALKSSQVSYLLLSLEMKGLIKVLPGNLYAINQACL
jgi:DNA processing protein